MNDERSVLELVQGPVTVCPHIYSYTHCNQVQYSSDASSWTYAEDGKVYTANDSDGAGKVENKFAVAVNTRYVRIVVQHVEPALLHEGGSAD
jgi:hypothetical protein